MEPAASSEDHVVRADRARELSSLNFTYAEVELRTRAIHARVLAESPFVQSANFTRIGGQDLRTLFDLYDADFFARSLGRMLQEDCEGRIAFRLSRRMTSAAGKTTRWRKRQTTADGSKPRVEYEIAISTTLLFATFGDGRSGMVVGLECHDRLEALQRVFEHELIHLAEMLAWGASSCFQDNFRMLARQIFGHPATKHQLMTPREVAAQKHNIRVGQRVCFEFEGKRYTGMVNRITRRASVLVPDAAGRLHSDGQRYRTYYVPLSQLHHEGPAQPEQAAS